MVLTASFSDVLGSPAWGVGATVFAALAIVVAIVLARQTRVRKALTYQINLTELVSVHRGARDRIKILYEDEQVENAELLQVRLRNGGNTPIRAGDFERPFSVVLKGGGVPLTVEPEGDPEDLRPEVEISGSAARLKPLLLNPGDSVQLNVFVRDFEDFDFDYRIDGIPDLTAEAPPAEITFADVLPVAISSAFNPLGAAIQAAVSAVTKLLETQGKKQGTESSSDGQRRSNR